MEFKKYFSKAGDLNFKCLQKMDDGEEVCSDVVAVSKDTCWNLKRHLIRKHPDVVKKHEEKQGKLTTTSI